MAVVALVGIKGNLGYKLFPELVSSPSISRIHVLSRKPRSTPSTDPKVRDFQVDYHDQASLARALTGVDVVVNAMGTEGDFQLAKRRLIDAAAKACVKVYFPRWTS
jgi:uncharacterized protein YbjT (DUF2867 family)